LRKKSPPFHDKNRDTKTESKTRREKKIIQKASRGWAKWLFPVARKCPFLILKRHPRSKAFTRRNRLPNGHKKKKPSTPCRG